jgi:hypothetical protein
MVVKNDLLGGSNWALGSRLYSADLNDTFDATVGFLVGNYRVAGLNLIRQLEDRAITFSADGGEWAEAYTSAEGRFSSVDVVVTNSFFIEQTKTYYSFRNETNLRATGSIIFSSATDTTNAFDGNSGTYCTISPGGTGNVGRDFGSGLDIGFVFINISQSPTFIVEYSDNNSDWFSTGITNITYVNNSFNYVGKSFRYIRLRNTGGAINLRLNQFEPYSADTSESFITHNIPTGMFPSTISSTVGVPKLSDWESGSDVQYKLLNRSDETSHVLGGTTQNPDSFTNPENFFDENDSTSAEKAITAPGSASLGKTFTSKYIYSVNVSFARSGTGTLTYLDTFNGSTWDEVINLGSLSLTTNVIINNTIQGIRLRTVATTSRTMSYTYLREIDGVVVDDSGWLETNKLETFTAFTNEPEYCVVKLIPKSTSPTPGFPSISGFALFSDKKE